MKSHHVFKEELLRDPAVKAEYDRLGPVYEKVGTIIDKRPVSKKDGLLRKGSQ